MRMRRTAAGAAAAGRTIVIIFLVINNRWMCLCVECMFGSVFVVLVGCVVGWKWIPNNRLWIPPYAVRRMSKCLQPRRSYMRERFKM
jgi:hypothetical protein